MIRKLRLDHVETGTQYGKRQITINGITRGFIEQVDSSMEWQAKRVDDSTVIDADPIVGAAVTLVLEDPILVPQSASFNTATNELTVYLSVSIDAVTSFDGIGARLGELGTWSQSSPVTVGAPGATSIVIPMTQTDATVTTDMAVFYENSGVDLLSEVDSLVLPDFDEFPVEVI